MIIPKSIQEDTRIFNYYEEDAHQLFTVKDLYKMFMAYSLEERQHEAFEDWLTENIKMQILVESSIIKDMGM